MLQNMTASACQLLCMQNNDTVPKDSTLPSAILDCRTLAAELRVNGTWPD